ncbi:hypothetical protein ABW19_dt0208777 [Dactylella cylindrospora]|nr:hypothetical protein ABW19_dt0208777 [Dactylella cylindrospora]
MSPKFLPAEILNEIASQACLSRRDLCSLSLVSKSFYAAAKYHLQRGEITFRATRLQQFFFLRRLLEDPNFGNGFTSITINWERKIATPGENPLSKYKWTESELSILRDIAKKYNFQEHWQDAIENLKVPDALLMPILCLLDNLEVLDLRKPYTHEYVGASYSDCLDTYLVESINRLILGEFRNVTDVKELWKTFPKGLLSLKSFSMGYCFDDGGFDIDSIISIFLLPNIERVEFTQFGGEFDGLARFEESGFKSNIRHIRFYEMEALSEEVARFLRFCERLETVKISLEVLGLEIAGDWEDLDEDFGLRPMVDALMECHRGSLVDAMLEGNRNWWYWKKTKKKVYAGWKPEYFHGEEESEDEGKGERENKGKEGEEDEEHEEEGDEEEEDDETEGSEEETWRDSYI